MKIMINCKCGVPAFFYELIKSDNSRYSVYKCGILSSESKRGRCNLNSETFINKVKIETPQVDLICKETLTEIDDTNNEIYKNLENYIHLLEISQNNYGMSKDNYISNINYLLKKLNMPLFFQKKENLLSLKCRIYDTPCKKKSIKSLYPISILEIPENLRIQNKKSIRKTKIVFNKNSYTKSMSRIVLDTKDILDSIKKLEIKSDSENDSESENEEDCSFDVDISDSEVEDNFFEDGGDFSD
jgi:hypothetical protein